MTRIEQRWRRIIWMRQRRAQWDCKNPDWKRLAIQAKAEGLYANSTYVGDVQRSLRLTYAPFILDEPALAPRIEVGRGFAVCGAIGGISFGATP